MIKKKIIVGSRDSKLAVIQAEIVINQLKEKHPELEIKLITMKTTGDIILDKTLDKIGGKGLFVKELDQALRAGTIDIAVHSLKDMPAELPDDLPLLAVSKREDPRDVLLLPVGIFAIDPSQPVGCSSARRTLQLHDLYPEARVESVRGNVLTRLRKMDEGKFGGLLLAHAGLIRLGLQGRVNRIFSTEEMIPSGGQGILAIQGRQGENPELNFALNDLDSWDQMEAEREFIRCLDGGCSSPIAAYAETKGSELCLSGFYVDTATGLSARGKITGQRTDAKKIGQTLALQLLREVSQ